MKLFPQPVKEGEDAQRAFFVGKTRSGKTYAMLQAMKPFVGHTQVQILNSKNDRTLRNIPGAKYVYSLAEINQYKFPEYPIVVYIPMGEEMNPKFLDKWCQWIYERGNTLAFVDEITQVAEGTRPGQGFINLYTRGAARGITVFGGNQRPRNLPKICETESEHFYVFRLKSEEDRKHVAQFTHPAVIRPVTDKHGFFYYPDGDDKVYYVKSL